MLMNGIFLNFIIVMPNGIYFKFYYCNAQQYFLTKKVDRACPKSSNAYVAADVPVNSAVAVPEVRVGFGSVHLLNDRVSFEMGLEWSSDGACIVGG